MSKKSKKARSADTSRGTKRAVSARWRPLDSAIAAILIANVMLLAVVVAWPSAPEKQDDTTATKSTPDPKVETDEVPKAGVDTTRIPILPRNELWRRAQREAADGRLNAAIATLQLLLREEPRMGEVPRRAIWLQLSYLAGIAGREEDASRWLRLSKASLELALVPDELLRLAREATAARDWGEARRYAARFLLQRGQLGADAEARVAEAYMILGDSYRDEAGVASIDRTGANERNSDEGSGK